jgi:hypothetical protein
MLDGAERSKSLSLKAEMHIEKIRLYEIRQNPETFRIFKSQQIRQNRSGSFFYGGLYP